LGAVRACKAAGIVVHMWVTTFPKAFSQC
jgi:hypothetical protein